MAALAARKIVVTRRRKRRSRSGVVSIKALARSGSGHTSSKRGKFTTGLFLSLFGAFLRFGDVDPRLPVQEPVLGVIAESGATVGLPHRLRKVDPEPRRIYSGREHHA
jgi:hypothetical protein